MADNNRIQWLLGQMADAGVEALAAFSPAWHTMADTNAARMLTGYKNMDNAAVILDRDAGITLVVSPAWDGERAAESGDTAQVIATDDFAATVAGAVDGGGQIGVCGLGSMPRKIAAPIRTAWANRMRPMDDVMRRAGRCKTPDEIARARELAAVAEKLFDRLVECARPGIHEFALAAELHRYSKSLGADDNFLLMSSSQMHHAPRPPNRRVMNKGDLILGEISPGADGQYVQICRTAVLGPINDIQRKNYEILWRSMERGLQAAKPGRTVSEVASAMNQAVAEGGYPDYCAPPYFRVRGHGLGNISSLPGDIETGNETVLEEGMTFVMHPNQYLPGSGYMFCGEPVVITASGAEPLSTRYSRLTSIPV